MIFLQKQELRKNKRHRNSRGDSVPIRIMVHVLARSLIFSVFLIVESETESLRQTVIREIVTLGKHLADRLKILESIMIPYSYTSSKNIVP